ncbi:acyl-[acyl-carrier-protein] thioesterase [Rhodohalobacter mucosus]|uniref:Acyl-[acyl-carrier-protein] thioesterase n=1 Tax=Rhodohalobacter mucosus TaxID=2079485 RepID=A0A316U227_9BACT|nr:acyl-ACP thioesterase domain-containing protein [Rhodohalobacter mucosus]PWN07146.1 acyl-[acyl-carrier-protein] thioesterase [Rhodohalobacter mucosus]
MNHDNSLQREYTVPFKVRSYEVDDRGRATTASICNYFQEAAGIHADHLQFDISQLRKEGLTWVLWKMNIHLYRYPSRWDEVIVKTRPSEGDGLRAMRDYELLDPDGQRLAAAVSQWMVLNLKTRRPVRLPGEILKLGLKEPSHIVEPDKKPLKTVPLSPEEETTPVTWVGKHHLDMNGHVNNVAYISWFTGYLSDSATNGRACRELNIQYMAECVEGDEIYIAQKAEQADSGVNVSQTLYKGKGDGEKFEPISAAVSVWL